MRNFIIVIIVAGIISLSLCGILAYRAGIRHAMTDSHVAVYLDGVVEIYLDGQVYEHRAF